MARIDELERRLAQTSQNSSKPPSSDPPSAPKRPPTKPSGRKPGGQPGHRGRHRQLLPPDKVDRVEDHWPSACRRCQHDLPARWRKDARDPVRHQVTELPPITPTTAEHRLHSQYCPSCGVITCAVLPADVPHGAFGPRLVGLIALLAGCYRLSKRTVVEVAKDLFGVDLSLGSVTACEKAAGATLASPFAEAHDFVRRSEGVLHADETGWREGRQRAWLWVAATAVVTVFQIARGRGKQAAKALLEGFRGVLVTDRWDGYLWYPGLRQICWSHLLRDFQEMSERRGAAGRVGRLLVGRTKKMFKLWRRARDGTLTRAGFRRQMQPVRLDFERLLKLGQRGRTSIAGSCGEMLKLFGSFFTFVDHEGVEPTNNLAERQIRHAVIWRKSSFGTHSAQGSRFVERMLTVRATLRQQGRNVVEFIVHAQEAALRGELAMSLLPTVMQPALLAA